MVIEELINAMMISFNHAPSHQNRILFHSIQAWVNMLSVYNLGSTGSDSNARVANTHSWTRSIDSP